MCEPDLTSFAKSMVLPDTSAVHDKNDSGQLPQVSREQESVCVCVCFEWRREVLSDSCGESLQLTMRKTHYALVRSTHTLRLQHIYK